MYVQTQVRERFPRLAVVLSSEPPTFPVSLNPSSLSPSRFARGGSGGGGHYENLGQLGQDEPASG